MATTDNDEDVMPRAAMSRQGPAGRGTEGQDPTGRDPEGRDPAGRRWWRSPFALWTWVALPVLALAMVFVPNLPPAAFRLLWGYPALAAVFLACRTKTVTWSFTTVAFAAGCLLAPVIAAAELAVANLVDADMHTPDGAVLVAAPVEETLKLLPLGVLLLVARRALATFAVTDYLLLGVATGLGVQAAEEALRGLSESGTGPGSVGLARTLRTVVFQAVPDPTNMGGPTFAGHHAGTALILVAIGLALRGRRRFGLAAWLLPSLVSAMVVVDHALYNASAVPVVPGSGVPGSGVPGGHDVAVPGWLDGAWRLWGTGTQEIGLLAALLVVALVADVRRTRRVWLLLPPVPDIGFVGSMRRWSHLAAVSLQGRVPGVAPRWMRGLAGVAAGFLRWLGYMFADLLGELTLLLLAAGRDRNGDSGTAEEWALRRRWVHAVAALRMRRRFAQRIGREVERSGVAPVRLPSFALAGLAALAFLAFAGATLLGAAGPVAGPVAGSVPAAGVAGVAAGSPAALADATGGFADWWSGLWLVPQVLSVLALAALLTLLVAGLLPDTGRRGPVASAEELLNHPRRVTSQYLTSRKPGETAGYLVEYLVSRLPLVPGGKKMTLARREIGRMVTAPDRYARAQRTLVERVRDREVGTAPRSHLPRQVTDRLQAGRRVRVRRQPCYPANSVILDRDRRFDAYLPYRAMVSRKFSQLGQVKPEIAIAYLTEAAARFTPGDVLVDMPYNRSNFRTLVGTKLRGEVRLEAPVQETPIPPEVLAAADQLGVVIVDETGRVYNQ